MRPLFLAAPGVANAQSAYYSFSRYLAWSTQPIYVLEKDNALNIAQLARRNAGATSLAAEQASPHASWESCLQHALFVTSAWPSRWCHGRCCLL